MRGFVGETLRTPSSKEFDAVEIQTVLLSRLTIIGFAILLVALGFSGRFDLVVAGFALLCSAYFLIKGSINVDSFPFSDHPIIVLLPIALVSYGLFDIMTGSERLLMPTIVSLGYIAGNRLRDIASDGKRQRRG